MLTCVTARNHFRFCSGGVPATGSDFRGRSCFCVTVETKRNYSRMEKMETEMGMEMDMRASEDVEMGMEMDMRASEDVEMGMEMDMRASEDVEMGRDITPPLPPIAYSLHDSFLLSHCSSCFSPLSSSLRYPPLLPSPHPCVFYCSPHCSSSDSPIHFSSAEFHLLHTPSLPEDDSADLRAALRLIHSFPSPVSLIDRVFGMLTNRHKLLSSGNIEILTGIRDGARAMAAARRVRFDVAKDDDDDDVVLEEAALCLVITNAVEVQDGEGRAIGVALYDTTFSWINHSCSPNACYRFFLSPPETECSSSGESLLRIVPTANHVKTQGICTIFCA